ncbi:hypothetical protein CLOM_g5682 [Closterium sp. NIES-68]|nr:hypothetical protein CLOM_g5682 [Closterium sp. NIES-68]GJP64036.1 hypothetical protein CLOP_g21070 [Closterium sp. NIES-67]
MAEIAGVGQFLGSQTPVGEIDGVAGDFDPADRRRAALQAVRFLHQQVPETTVLVQRSSSIPPIFRSDFG